MLRSRSASDRPRPACDRPSAGWPSGEDRRRVRDRDRPQLGARGAACAHPGHRAVRRDADRIDDRVKEVMSLATKRGLPILEVMRPELDRMAGFDSVHQGLALKVPPYEYAHPLELLDKVISRGQMPLFVALDGMTDPAQPGRDHPLRGRVRRPGRDRAAAALGGDDGGGLEDVGRGGGAHPGRDGRQPHQDAEGPQGPRRLRARPGRRRRRLAARPDLGEGARSSSSSAARARACPAWSPRPATRSCRSRSAPSTESLNAGIAASVTLYEIAKQRAAQ